MAILRDKAYCNFNFLVDLGDGNTDGATAGFEEVILPQRVLPPPESEEEASGPTLPTRRQNR